MTIKHGGKSFVLCGPPIKFVAEALPERPENAKGEGPVQLSLF
jgi:hypothetical protein